MLGVCRKVGQVPDTVVELFSLPYGNYVQVVAKRNVRFIAVQHCVEWMFNESVYSSGARGSSILKRGGGSIAGWNLGVSRGGFPG